MLSRQDLFALLVGLVLSTGGSYLALAGLASWGLTVAGVSILGVATYSLALKVRYRLSRQSSSVNRERSQPHAA